MTHEPFTSGTTPAPATTSAAAVAVALDLAEVVSIEKTGPVDLNQESTACEIVGPYREMDLVCHARCGGGYAFNMDDTPELFDCWNTCMPEMMGFPDMTAFESIFMPSPYVAAWGSSFGPRMESGELTMDEFQSMDITNDLLAWFEKECALESGP